MAEFEEKLNSILGNQEAMGQIMALAHSLSTGEREGEQTPPSPQPHQEEQQEQPDQGTPDLSALLGQLEHEQLDFALIEGAFDRSRFGSRLFRRSKFVGLCRRDHPFAGRTIPLTALEGQCLVVREEGSGTRGILENVLAERGYSLDLFSRVICANQFSLITRFVAEGCGITFAYEPVAAGQPELAFFHLDCLDETREFSLVYLKGTHIFPLVREVLGELTPSDLEEGAE